MVPKRQLPTGASGTRAAYRAPDSNLRCLLRVLGLTTPWAVPLLGFAALPAFVFSGWLLILTVAAVWLSYAVHETAHVIFSRRTGTRDGPTLLVRRGPTIRVVAATPSPRDRRRIAAAGPASRMWCTCSHSADRARLDDQLTGRRSHGHGSRDSGACLQSRAVDSGRRSHLGIPGRQPRVAAP